MVIGSEQYPASLPRLVAACKVIRIQMKVSSCPMLANISVVYDDSIDGADQLWTGP